MDSTNNSATNLNPMPGPTPGAPRPEGPGAPVSPPVAPPVPPMSSANPVPATGVGTVPVAPTQPMPGANTAPSATVSAQPTVTQSRPVAPRPPVPPLVPGATPTGPVMRPTNIDGINSAAIHSASVPGLTDEVIASQVEKEETLSTDNGVAVAAEEATEVSQDMPAENSFVMNEERQTPSVSFADPITQPEINTNIETVSAKKKSNRTALIVLSVIAFVVAAALAAVLIMVVMGIGPFSMM